MPAQRFNAKALDEPSICRTRFDSPQLKNALEFADEVVAALPRGTT